jgi:hypothetical protein
VVKKALVWTGISHSAKQNPAAFSLGKNFAYVSRGPVAVIPEIQREMTYSDGPGGTKYRTALASDTVLIIDPHPAILIHVMNFVGALLNTYSTLYAAVFISFHLKSRTNHTQAHNIHLSQTRTFLMNSCRIFL